MVRAAAGVLAAAVVLVLAGAADAQLQPGKAEVKRVTGKVEVMAKGQTQWAPVQVGTKLGAGDDLRAHAKSSAELALPDG
jgi:hypothetical protein